MKIFDDFFEDFSISKFFGDRFQNALTFFIINRFGRDFFKSCVDFHGGHDGTGFRVSGAFIGDITEYNWPSKNLIFPQKLSLAPHQPQILTHRWFRVQPTTTVHRRGHTHPPMEW